MKKNSLFITVVVGYYLLVSLPLSAIAQAPQVKMSKALGGSVYERSYDIKNLSGGRYIVAGYASSTDGQVSGLHSPGYYDAWIVVIDSTGKILKKICAGGIVDDKAFGVAIKGDGTYGVCGTTSSPDALPLRTPLYGRSDIYFFNLLGATLGQLDSLHFGGTYYDDGVDILRSKDSAYVLLGHTASVDSDAVGNHGIEGTYDIIVIKSGGFIKLIGGSANEFARRIIQASDGGYLIVGTTNSTDGDVTGFHGGVSDGFVAKLNSSGTLLWTKCYGGSGTDEINSGIQTPDGGYLLVGGTNSADGDATGNSDLFYGSVWVLKISASGTVQKKKFYGGTREEAGRDVVALPDGTYAVASHTNSSNGDVIGNFNGDYCCYTTDAWLIDVNTLGDIVWQGSYGGGGSDYPTRMILNSKEKIVISGYTGSASGQMKGFHGNEDMWVTRLGDLVCGKPVNLKTATILSDGASLLWDLVPGALKYEYRIRLTGGTWTYGETSSGSPAATVVGLTPATDYEFQVRATCKVSPLLQSIWSSNILFTTSSVSTPSIYIKSILVKPNPVTGSSVSLSYTLTKPGNIIIKIMNMDGIISQIYDAGIQFNGANNYTLNRMTELKNGNYFLMIQQDGMSVAYTRLAIAH